MDILETLIDEMNQLAGVSSNSPQTITATGPDQVQIAVDVTGVDSFSCTLQELRLSVPSLHDADFDTLKKWSESLSQRVNYLLENIGPLEVDPHNGRVLIRSTPPLRSGDGTSFYEVMLASHSGGNFSLRRFRSQTGQAGRDQVEMHITKEVFRKLVTDLIETIPED